MLQEVIHQKEKIIVLMKRDLADAIQTDKWLQHFEAQGTTAIALDVNNKKDIQQFIELVTEKGIEKQRKLIEKGVQQRAVRALIVGIPNVGKSTLINRLANKKIAKIGDRPGVTKMQQWIKVKQKFELLDTPGILWPKFEDELIGLRVAAIGSIKDEILPLQDVVAFLLQYIYETYPNLLKKR